MALPHLPQKIRRFCEVAYDRGFRYAWIDLCCIDTKNTAEVSEATIARFSWYANAGACFVYLPEVDDHEVPLRRLVQFKSSKWFSRTRTLQELLAPGDVTFLSKQWSIIGTKHSLASVIESRTFIGADVLTRRKPLESVSIARRMFWASHRSATRVEDEAYWLAGIFGVTLQPMYGEGRAAFLRLQEEIIKHIPEDQTIFAWGHLLKPPSASEEDAYRSPTPPTFANAASVACSRFSTSDVPPYPSRCLLASSPKDFKQWSSRLTPVSVDAFAARTGISSPDALASITSFSRNTLGRLPIAKLRGVSGARGGTPSHVALLACEDPDANAGLAALLLRPQESSLVQFYVGGLLDGTTEPGDPQLDTVSYKRAIYIADPRKSTPQLSDVYIPKRPSRSASEFTRDASLRDTLSLAPREELDVKASCSGPAFPPTPLGLNITAAHDTVLSYDATFDPSPQVFEVKSHNNVLAKLAIGRCACPQGRARGSLALVLGSDTRSSSDNPPRCRDCNVIHVSSWSFCAGIASTEVSLPHAKLRLTLNRGTTEDASANTSKAHFHLHVEVELPVQGPVAAALPREDRRTPFPSPIHQRGRDSTCSPFRLAE